MKPSYQHPAFLLRQAGAPVSPAQGPGKACPEAVDWVLLVRRCSHTQPACWGCTAGQPHSLRSQVWKPFFSWQGSASELALCLWLTPVFWVGCAFNSFSSVGVILPSSCTHPSCYPQFLPEPLSPRAHLYHRSCSHYPNFAHCPWGPVTAVEAAHVQSVGAVANGKGHRRGPSRPSFSSSCLCRQVPEHLSGF